MQRRAAGSTLLITLFFISLISVLVVGFLSNMEMELGASHSHLDGVLAEVYAEAGLDTGLSGMAAALGTTNTAWISGPGRLAAFPTRTENGLGTMTGTNAVALSSGAAPGNAGPDEAAELNPSFLLRPRVGLVSPSGGSMRAGWIYVLKLGGTAANLPPYDPQNPVVGRYAYWVDDEGAKIDLNTAARRENGLSAYPAQPGNVALMVLPGLGLEQVEAVTNARAVRPFESVAETARLPGMERVVATNRFSLTAFNHAPERNMFGEARIVLTTRAGMTNGLSPLFLDILRSPDADPGSLQNLSPDGVNRTLSLLTNELARPQWPFLPPDRQAFGVKYQLSAAGRSGSDVLQMAVDIIDYVRSAESALPSIEPLRLDDETRGLPWSGTGGNRLGVGRAPRVAEIGAARDGASLVFKIRLYLPPIPPNGAGWSGIDLTAYRLEVVSSSLDAAALAPIAAGEVNDGAGPSVLAPGHYATITRRLSLATVPGSLKQLRVVLLDGAGGVVESAPSVDPIDALPVADSAAAIVSVSVDDPMANRQAGDFQPGTGNSFGRDGGSSRATLGSAPDPACRPAQDTGPDGKLALGYALPAPKGSAANPLGVVRSVGELGYLHTGVCSAHGVRGALIGTPWRTLRLQPQTTDDGARFIPDWAVLDLFVAPMGGEAPSPLVLVTNEVFHGTNAVVAGRVNVNADLGLNGADGASLTRPLPVAALIAGAVATAQIAGGGELGMPLSSNAALSLAGNVAGRVLASTNLGGVAEAGVAYRVGNLDLYSSPGQLAEIKGIADGGESSEELLREILPLATARGDVFTLYAVGQSLSQDRQGRVHVQGERRLRQTVERYQDGEGNNRFRTVDSRILTP
ncbi:MAG: hypothetical protein PW734_11685 [Verrucomicrobium sp.]|nr:hypothetical protein [Verrucomicrobium sp.]